MTLREQIWAIAIGESDRNYPAHINHDLSAAVNHLASCAVRQRWDRSDDIDTIVKVAAIRRALMLFSDPGEIRADALAITAKDIVLDEPAPKFRTLKAEAVLAARKFVNGRGQVWGWVGPDIREALIDAEVMDHLRYYVDSSESIRLCDIKTFRNALINALAIGVDDSEPAKPYHGRLWFRIHDDGKVL